MSLLKSVHSSLKLLLLRGVVALGYVVLFALSYWLAFAFRFDFDFENNLKQMETCYRTIGGAVLLKFMIFFYYKQFNDHGLSATFKDIQVLAKSSFFASISFFVLVLYLWELHLPRTVPALDCILTIFLIGTVRFGWRLLHQELIPRLQRKNYRRTVLIGANSQGVSLVHELSNHPKLGYRIVGFISIHNWKRGQLFGQIPVIGHIDELDRVLQSHGIQEVLTFPSILQGDQMRKVMAICQQRDIRLRIVPSIETRLGGATIPMRDIRIEDLLRRDTIQLDDTSIGKLLSGRRILVTGAGGSIGSEICRQIMRFHPETLIILGRGENRIFYLETELRQHGFQGQLISVIGDVTNETRMAQVFRQHKPHVVFHAAAHKHVPLMEANVAEAVHNNLKGTKVLADLAHRVGTDTFVLISTDKAVNPTSVMGATKHMAERYVLSLAMHSQTAFIVTRFGNVLGSAGSVVPLFRNQIAAGGPITVTDFRMTRYFMTIPEASQLVLQAAAMGVGEEIFVLDMGEPVCIVDLARDLIRLSGLPEHSVEIREIGLRPGEKLHEELYFESEKALKTAHPKLRCITPTPVDQKTVENQVRELLASLDVSGPLIREKLQGFIEEYRPEPGGPVLTIFSKPETGEIGDLRPDDSPEKNNDPDKLRKTG